MERFAWLLLGLSAACSDTGGPGAEPGVDGGVIFWRPSAGGDDLGVDRGTPDLGPPEDGGVDPADVGLADDGVGSDLGPEGCDDPVEAIVTASVAAAGGELVNSVVEVGGSLVVGPSTCSDQVCPDDDPCCQRCTAPVRLDDVLELRVSPCTPFRAACQGSNCSLTCSPPLLGIPVRFRGRVLDDGAFEVLERLP